jgi:hypothetical protein
LALSRTRDAVRELEWFGDVQRDGYNPSYVEARDALADAAKAYDWSAVLLLLEREPALVNSWRVGGTSWYTPLHQAAHGGAPPEVVERLISLGAWRTLRNAKGQLAVDIAQEHGRRQLLPLLETSPARSVHARALERMQGHFHEVIRGRVAAIEGVLARLRLPDLGPLTELPSAKFWFSVPGMFGGFAFWLAADGERPMLVSENWCRVVDGSGERHEVTPEGARLIERGFV